MKGKHRQLFDAPDPDGGTVLRHSRGYLDTWRDVYGVAEHDVSLVVTFYGRTTPLGVQDAMWEKYKLGAAIHSGNADTVLQNQCACCKDLLFSLFFPKVRAALSS